MVRQQVVQLQQEVIELVSNKLTSILNSMCAELFVLHT